MGEGKNGREDQAVRLRRRRDRILAFKNTNRRVYVKSQAKRKYHDLRHISQDGA